MLHILVANVGSTSLKYKLVGVHSPASAQARYSTLASGSIERIGLPGAKAIVEHIRPADQGQMRAFTSEVEEPDYASAIGLMLRSLTEAPLGVLEHLSTLDAIGFKAVHGGVYRQPVIVTEQVLAEMERMTPAAPAHNPPYILAMRLFQQVAPAVPLVAVWETSFHATMPDYARVYAVPRAWQETYGIEHYGFHGASHRYISRRVAELAPGASPLRVISCHLGGSSSVCAIRDGQSIDTSMGFSPQSGLPQTKRTGDLDPFVLLWLIEQGHATPQELNSILNTQSGLAGISGTSGDMRDLLAAEASGNDRARLAIDAFCYALVKTIGSYYVALNGLDRLVFTGGIGEKGAAIRSRVIQSLACLGIYLDEARNAAAIQQEAFISSDHSSAQVWAIPTDEGQIVAEETARYILAQRSPHP
ncbi:MAG TPA: acetate/propionate family kinase [Ktedonobacteraceae bacterium]|nr:acetate/propionate family kinase [Ktedonobacteraceae bacterium]